MLGCRSGDRLQRPDHEAHYDASVACSCAPPCSREAHRKLPPAHRSTYLGCTFPVSKRLLIGILCRLNLFPVVYKVERQLSPAPSVVERPSFRKPCPSTLTAILSFMSVAVSVAMRYVDDALTVDAEIYTIPLDGRSTHGCEKIVCTHIYALPLMPV